MRPWSYTVWPLPTAPWGRISGCWIGLHPDGKTLAGPANGVSGFRYRVRDEFGADLESIRINDVVIGLPKDTTNALADFNVLVGLPAIPVILEGHGARIAGNFFGVGVDGQACFTNAVPVVNAAGGAAQYRFGSNFDGVSDELEGNAVFNYWPPELFGPEYLYQRNPLGLGFFDELAPSGPITAPGAVVFTSPFSAPVRLT